MIYMLRMMAAVGCLSFAASSFAADFGRTHGKFGVSPSGAATYSIPIWTPPGPNGLTPSISLDYNSQAPNGIGGVGWNLSAVSSIERCNRTKHQDASAAPVDLGANDKFCINGRRLRLSSGSYGAAGSVYFTEIADFSRVTAYGAAAGGGPERFLVEAKNGLYYEYGYTANSRVMLGTTVFRWMLSKVRDRSGNNYVIGYNNADGFATPDVIQWTPTSFGASTYRYEAKFNYFNDRSDADSYFGRLANHYIVNESRIENIQIKSSGAVIRKYRFAYDISPNTSRSRLTSAKECADDAEANCFLPITLAYQGGQAGVSPGAGAAPPNSSNGLVPGRYDLNGDGKDDIAYLSGGICHVAFGANTGFAGPYSVGTNGCGVIDRFMPNGRDAVAVTIGGIRWIYKWNDSTSAFVGVNTGASGGETVAADYNGDGLADFVSHAGNQLYVRRNTSTAASVDPTFGSTSWAGALPTTAFGGSPSFDSLTSYYGNGLQRADLNGDGLQEIFALIMVNLGVGGATPYSAVLQATGAGYSIPAPSAWTSPAPTFSINFNGDACTDRVLSTTVYISHCSGIAASTLTAPAFPSLILDWNADGKSDFLIGSGGTYFVYLSTGAGLSSPIATSISAPGALYAFDQDGDRQDDVVSQNGSAAISYWTHTSAGYVPTSFATNIPDLLSSAVDGFGLSFTPDYVSTAWSSYSQGAATAYPLQQSGPRIVVARTTMSDGIGGTYNKTYYYTGARTHAERGDPVGFQRVDITDNRSGQISRTHYEQAFPKAGMIKQQELVQSNNTTIRNTTFTNVHADLSTSAYNQRYFAYSSGSTATEYELGGSLNGSLLRTIVTANTYHVDTGTIYDRWVTTTEPASGANGLSAGGSWTVRTYAPLENIYTDYNNWCIGRLGLVYDQRWHNLAYGDQITLNSYSYWDTVKCRVDTIIHDYDTPSLRIDTTLGYDSFGNLTSSSVVGAGMTARTSLAVYSDGANTTGQFPLSATNALSQTSYTAWNYDLGLPASTTDPNGIVTSWQYDSFGRRSRENLADGTYIQWQYISCATFGLCSATSKVFAMWTHRDSGGARVGGDHGAMLDAFERKTVEYEPTFGNPANFSNVVTTEFDALGRVARKSIPKMSLSTATYWTSYGYDLMNRLTSVSRPVSDSNPTLQTTTYSYQGLSTYVTDPNGKQTRQIVNAAGQLSRTQDHDLYAQTFDHDAFGNPKRIQDSAGNTLQTSNYNIRGVLVSRSDMDMGTWTYNPNALDEIVNIRDAKTPAPAWTQTLGYDLLGRLTSRQETEGTSVWTWGVPSDNTASNKYVGHLKSVAGPGYSEAYVYDHLARPFQTTISADATYQINYSYNAKGQLHTVAYPTSTNGCRFTLQYSYSYEFLKSLSNASNAAQCGSTGETYWTANEGNGFGQIFNETLGNGLVLNRNFDLVTARLKSIQTGAGGGAGVQNLAYEWDLVGNLKKRRDLNQSNLTEEFFYDNLYRLDYSTRNGSTNLDLAYDLLGNITNKSDVGAYAYHSTKKHQIVSAGVFSGFAFDANGNMTTGGGTSVDWTTFNYASCIRSSAAACSGSSTNWSSFSYTPDRNYWRQQSNYVSGGAATTIYVGGILEKVTASGATDYRHMIRAGNATVIVSRKTSGTNTTNYVTQDHLGSSSVITNSTGGVLINSSFDAYGKRRGSNWTGNPSAGDWTAIAGTTRRGYTDHSMLDNVGLIHMNGRVHNPVLGRFMSADPYITDHLNTQNYNRYSYVYNNPLSFTDPSGFETDEVCQHQGSAGCLPEIVVQCDAACQAAQRAQETAQEQLWGQANSSQSFQVTDYGAMANEFLGNLLGVKTLDCVLFENCGNKSWGEGVVEAGLDRVPVTKVLTFAKNMVEATKAAKAVVSIGAKIEKQMGKRGWSRESLDDAIANPTRTVATKDTRHLPGGGRMDEPATAYYGKDGGYVIRNDRTGDIVQVSDRTDTGWVAPWD